MIKEKYRIIKELGHGGEGKVYLVQHRLTEQFRAAKVIRNQSGVRRFQELNAMKRLEHPGLPQIYDVLEEKDQIWLIMEYVRGRCIHELDITTCSQKQFFSIAGQLAEILVYLHTRTVPVFHLDIKPSNLLLREDGTLVLIDFGVAVRQTYPADLEVPKEKQELCRFGTPGFAAPEQFQRGILDGRSDLYGAGAVLYYYLFRKRPYKDSVESGRAMYRDLWKKGIRNPAIIWILQKCLCRNPDGRFADAIAFKKAVSRAERYFELCRKAGSTAAALLFLAVVSFFAAYQMKDLKVQEERMDMCTESDMQRQHYERILEQAGKLGLQEAVSYYQEAARQAGEDLEWLRQLLNRLVEDFSFDLEEEHILKEVLFRKAEETEKTVLEQIKSYSDFGEMSYQIGMAYWHYYEAAGGKSAAAEWFTQAVSAKIPDGLYTTESWIQQAQIYERIGKYYEMLGKTDENGVYQASMVTYWDDIKALWQMEDRGIQSLAVQRQLAEELLFCLIFYPHELQANEKKQEELQEILEEIEQFQEGNTAVDLQESCHLAKAAVERIYK